MDPTKNRLLEACKFSMNEIVLCYEPDPMKAKMLYDAKILDAEVTKDEKGKKVFEYYIHFQGWNKSWDRWILENKILKANETNRAIQTKLHDEAIRQKKRKPKPCSKNESCDEKEDCKSVTSIASDGNSDDVKASQIPLVTLDIPKVLAVRLEDDCYNIKRKKKLVHLPRNPTVNEIFNAYYLHCEKRIKTLECRNLSLKILYEMIHGLNTYFNYFLFSTLLYNFEREQYHTFFPEELKRSTDGLSPMPPITPKLVSPNSIGFYDSSRSNSRTSSFCEDTFSTSSAPLLKEVLKPKINRKRKGEGKAKSVDGVSATSTTTKRKKSYTISNTLTLELDSKISNRETRSAKKTVIYDRDKDCVYPKEEKAIKPMEILAENIIDMDRTVTRSKKYASKPYGNNKEISIKAASKETVTNKDSTPDESNNVSIQKGIETKVSNCSVNLPSEEIKPSSINVNIVDNKNLQTLVKEEKCSDKTQLKRDENLTIKSKDLINSNDTSTKNEALLLSIIDKNEDLNLNESDEKKPTTDGRSNKDVAPHLIENETTIEKTSKCTKSVTLENTKKDMIGSAPRKTDIDLVDEDSKKKSLVDVSIHHDKELIEKSDENNYQSTKESFNEKNERINVKTISLSLSKDSYQDIKIDTDNKAMQNDSNFNIVVFLEDNQAITPNSSKDCKETDGTCSDDNHLRGSMCPPKFPGEVDEQETLPIGSTAKSLFESYKTPLKLSTDTHHSDISHDKTFMVYPQTSDGNTPADIYGLEHLLRLFVKLPLLLAASHIEERKINIILKNVSHFLEYLSKQTVLFMDPSTIYSESII